jgi:glycosyltransferase involved in cell wall biosynthesis
VRIAFISTEPPYPDLVMGGQLDCHELAESLRRQGVHCALIAAALPPNYDGFWLRLDRKLDRTLGDNSGFRWLRSVQSTVWSARATWSKADFDGYDIYRLPARYLMQLMPGAIAAERPDVVVSQGHQREELALIAMSRGIAAAIRVVCSADVDSVATVSSTIPELHDAVQAGRIPIISNSEFVARLVRTRLAVDSPIIYPLVNFDRCLAFDQRPEHITFINPTPKKGVDLALQIAALLPHRKFRFVQSWRIAPKQRTLLEGRIKDLPNVQLRPATLDIRDVYQTTALLLAPSQVEEAFGRVVLEACANGIPVVASDIGGIPEALGAGGVLVDPGEPAQRWADAIESVLGDPHRYDALGSAGVSHSRQPKYDPQFITASLTQLTQRMATTHQASLHNRV